MAVIPMPTRPGRVPQLRLRDQDRFLRLPNAAEVGPSRFIGVLLGTAIVAGSLAGVLLYDATRVTRPGWASQPALVIPVEPVRAGGAQPR